MADTGFYHPIIELSLARAREFLRQGETVFWVFGMPVLMTIALGIAFRNSGPEKIVVGAEDAATQAALSSAPDMKVTLLSPGESAKALARGAVTLVVHANNDGSFEYRYDATRPESRVARFAVDDALQKARGRRDPAAVHDKKVTEPGSRYIDFLIPGLVGLNLMGSSMWALGFGVVDMRSKKLLKRLAATPMRRWHFLFSYMLSRLGFLFLELVVVIGFANVAFGVRIYGSLFDLSVVALIGAISFLALGMLVSARPTTLEGVSGWMNLIMLPMWLLSGTFFSSAKFPDATQPFIRALPLTALNDALRSVMSDGAGLGANLLQIGILAAWGVVSVVVAVRIFRWQ
jgi:ABC transporter DrrB family efflux protein